MPWTHALDLAKNTTKNNGVPTPVVRTSKWVPANILKMIQVGDNVIRETRHLLPHGAANQTFDTKSSGEVIHRNLAAQKASGQVGGGFTPAKPQIIAGAAVAFKAGTCQDQAAVVFLLLREELGAEYLVSYGYSSTAHHCYCLVKEVASIGGPSQTVVVDSWPKYPQALLWEDHFCCPEFLLYIEKTGKGMSGKIDKALAKYTNNPQAYNQVANLTRGLPWGGTTFYNQWASRSHQIYLYNNDDIVMS